MKTLFTRNSTSPSLLRYGFLLLVSASVLLAFSQSARAVCREGCDTTNQSCFLGDDALVNNTTGTDNTAIGYETLLNNTTGSENTATGYQALLSNTDGFENTAIGTGALEFNTSGSSNTATGWFALLQNTTGAGNTATGWDALSGNQTGSFNTATGGFALSSNIGSNNTANGFIALQGNIIGSNNTASGAGALFSNTSGDFNTAVGVDALRHNKHGSNNIALGSEAGSDLSRDDNIAIGNRGITGESNTIRIGDPAIQTATFVAGISGATVPTGVPVIVDINGHLGTTTSSGRFKEAIKPMDKASEAILALKPVSFRYKHELDPEGIPQFGLVAEDVEKVDRDLVARDAQGKPYTVRYEAVNTMLLNEFLKEHKTVQEQGATITQQRKDFDASIAQQQKEIAALTATVKQQAAQIQKVTTQLELSKSAPQTVRNDK
jgi:Chaperone of endosialidase